MHLLIRQDKVFPFLYGKIYPVGTGYMVLYDEEEEGTICCLCRILCADEVQMLEKKKHISYVCDTRLNSKKNEVILPTIPVVILGCVDSIKEADGMVEIYRRGLETLEKL